MKKIVEMIVEGVMTTCILAFIYGLGALGYRHTCISFWDWDVTPDLCRQEQMEQYREGFGTIGISIVLFFTSWKVYARFFNGKQQAKKFFNSFK